MIPPDSAAEWRMHDGVNTSRFEAVKFLPRSSTWEVVLSVRNFASNGDIVDTFSVEINGKPVKVYDDINAVPLRAEIRHQFTGDVLRIVYILNQAVKFEAPADFSARLSPDVWLTDTVQRPTCGKCEATTAGCPRPTGWCISPNTYVILPHSRLYEVVALHMCVLAYTYRTILKMLPASHWLMQLLPQHVPSLCPLYVAVRRHIFCLWGSSSYYVGHSIRIP